MVARRLPKFDKPAIVEEVAGTSMEHQREQEEQSTNPARWVNLFKEPQIEVKYYEPECVDGITFARIPKKEVESNFKKWENMVICKVIGGHPPLAFFEAFIRRISKGQVDKVWQMKPGIFMVKFMLKEQRDEAIARGMVFFDNKPVIVKEWKQNMNFEEPDTIPIWIQLPGLDMVYWEPSILCRMASTLGVPLRIDGATWEMDKTKFARVLVEMKLGDPLPDNIPYIDENEVIQHQKVEYEWLPIKCSKCSMIGHKVEECNREERQRHARQNQQNRVGFQPRQRVNAERPNQGKPNGYQQRQNGYQQRNNGGYGGKVKHVYVAVGKKNPEDLNKEHNKGQARKESEGGDKNVSIKVSEMVKGTEEVVSRRKGKEPEENVKRKESNSELMVQKNKNAGIRINEGGNSDVEVRKIPSFILLSDPPDDEQ